MKNKQGFTLIELLVVIAIIGILSSVVLTSLSSARNKATRAAFLAEVNGSVPGYVNTCDSGTIVPVSTSNTTWTLTPGYTDSCGPTGAGTFLEKAVNLKNWTTTAGNCILYVNNAGVFTAASDAAAAAGTLVPVTAAQCP